jgi:hypothetical protein
MPTVMTHAVVGVKAGARVAPLALCFTAITATHGVPDALTTGGPGSPPSWPWRRW